MGVILNKLNGEPLLIDIKEADLDAALQAKVNQGKIAGIITTILPSTGIVTDKVYEFAGVQGVPITGGTIKDTNGSTITTLQNGDSLWYNTATGFWYRIPFQNLANYYLKTEVDAMLLPIIQKNNDLFVIPLIGTGNGSGVSTLQLTVNASTTLYINGAGKFYDDAAGTTNEGITRTLTSGGVRTVYLKVTSGTCDITIVNGNLQVTQFNAWTSSTNAASINQMRLSALPATMTYFVCTGSNTITGNLSSIPATITSFVCTGSNTITGNLSSIPATMTSFNCQGSNTITGNLSSITATMTSFNCQGSNTITGNLSSITATMISFICTGSNTISDYTLGKDWANLMNYFYLIPASGGGLSSSEIDNLIIDLDNGNTWGGTTRTLYLKGTNAAPTAASAAAILSLQSKGVTVTTN